MPSRPAERPAIRIRGARQNNLRNLSLDLPLGELIVVTGVSGSGKSSLAFDTLYAEGQRRYIETFSPYARQFLDRMDRPQVDAIEGIPPAIAIDQTNPVRTSRSTVGTMTEINDHLKLLYARAAVLHCRGCGQVVRRDTPATILASLRERAAALGDPRLLVCFSVARPANLPLAELKKLLESQGYVRLREPPAGKREPATVEVIQDRLRAGTAEDARIVEALEAALLAGRGHLTVHALDDAEGAEASWRYSAGLHCADCDIGYQEPLPSHFSFNSPLGACETCRGFGRVVGIDYDLVIPDPRKTLASGAIKPWQTATGKECQDDMERYAPAAGVALDVPWQDLPEEHRRWVIEGDGKKGRKHWYGAKGYFDYLERKSYKMHVRVLLSRYRSYTPCPACHGARLKPESLLWKLGPYHVHQLQCLPIARAREFFAALTLPPPLSAADNLLLGEIRSRLAYLCDVGLSYLTLDRQSRTLSGGEVQRINLTTALGTSLVNTLFVMDEPSIGLHPRDMARVIGVMRKLRDAGNTLVVVEHDPQIMTEADRLIDMGPGAGEHGGRIVFDGAPAALRGAKDSLTAAYLTGRRQVQVQRTAADSAAPAQLLRLAGATLHNVRDVTLEVPLGRLVCVTGVSGSGKSTLIGDLLYPALQRALGKPAELEGMYRSLSGHEGITEAVFVDQTPIGRTTRSNPVSYVGAFDPIRALFAKLPEAVERKYTAGTFSFNSGTGRCPACGGNGFEHVEMQLLSDVYLRCSVCNGRRYRDETLELAIEGADGARANIAQVLDLTVTEALAFFAQRPEVLARLAPLADVGLDYLRLGQPVPTLAGGEAQRLKLAGYLADTTAGGRKLLIFDEPTTGLHFEDIARLMRAFGKLLERGHSLLVIEHNLDVIGNADWLIEMGPEGGEAGGRIVAAGTPAELRSRRQGHTGAALAAYAPGDLLGGHAVHEPRAAARTRAPDQITVHGAREHNLHNIDVAVPQGAMTVVTGVSGSGKSTLAFDIIFNEGQRRYLESLNAYARQFVQPASRPDVDAVHGIPPTVAIEQRTSRGGRKSTVATLTEIYPFLRLLYVKLGVQYCPDCEVAIEPQSAELIVARLMREQRGQELEVFAPLVTGRKGIYKELAAWAAARGHEALRVDGALLPTAKWPKLARYKPHDIELPLGTVKAVPAQEARLRQLIEQGLDLGKGLVQVEPAGSAQGRRTAASMTFSSRRACPKCGTGFGESDPRLFSYQSARGWCASCFGTGLKLAGFDAEQSGEESAWGEADATHVCESCHGERLNPVARAVKFRGRSIGELTRLSVTELGAFLGKLKLDDRETAIGADLLREITGRLGFLGRVGLDYLSLDRAAPTLSGGETQRLRLAAQLGSNLRGVCYVLDEPTIGLHPRDNALLLDALETLAEGRNTLVVVEHDEDTIRRADHVIDIGPGAGSRGGHIIAAGTVKDLLAAPDSITGRCLREPLQPPREPRRPVVSKGKNATPLLTLRGVTLHNLDHLDVSLPLGRLIAITGVSGSGKSTLAHDVLRENLALLLQTRKREQRTLHCRAIEGAEQIARVLEVDQSPIGKTPRSCPATYVGFWDAIRKVFAGTIEAGIRGYTASRFSFNTAGGRCEVCEGQGVRTVEMNFLPDVKVTCDACRGARFDPETLAVRWRERSIGDVLAMSVDEAAEFFRSHPAIHRPLALLQDVGLGYLTLGQQSPTLSGGEAQRIKLVTELARLRADAAPGAHGTLYVLDEPTVGLHMADVEKLLAVMHRLADAGNTLVVIEHNLDVIAQADWVIDLGPEAGPAGGKVVVAGPPATVAASRRSRTGAALAPFLEQRHAS
ncbi:MAG: excinuclease ABC subunit UvrA [Steroidobacteraceae bacterium]